MTQTKQQRSGGHVREGIPGGTRELVVYDLLNDDERVVDRVTRLEVVDNWGWRWYRADGDADQYHSQSDRYYLTEYSGPGMSGAKVVSVRGC